MLQFGLKGISGSILFYLSVVAYSFGQDAVQYEVCEHRNLSYFEELSMEKDTLQRLNLALPKGVDGFPLLVWIGGGAWSYVDRNIEMNLAKKFATEGIGVASIGHRLSAATWRDSTLNKGIKHPEHVKDIAASVKWLYEQATKYGYSKDKIFIGGFSSGAHLATLIGLDESYLKEVGLSRNVIKGMIPISGMYDVINYHEVFKNGDHPELAKLHVEAVFGHTKKDFLMASPTSYLDHLESPMLLISDNAIDRYTRLFERELRKTKFEAYNVIYVPDLNHAELWRNLSFEDSSRYRKAIVEFIKNNGKTAL